MEQQRSELVLVKQRRGDSDLRNWFKSVQIKTSLFILKFRHDELLLTNPFEAEDDSALSPACDWLLQLPGDL